MAETPVLTSEALPGDSELDVAPHSNPNTPDASVPVDVVELEDVLHVGRGTRESTELTRLRTIYSRASTQHRQQALATLQKPSTFYGRIVYNIKKFWRNQISVTVHYETCRDHLGTKSFRKTYLLSSLYTCRAI